MGELVSVECQRQGAWGLLGEGTGARLMSPDTGRVLTKEHIFGEFSTPQFKSSKTLSLNVRETAPSIDTNVDCNNNCYTILIFSHLLAASKLHYILLLFYF